MVWLLAATRRHANQPRRAIVSRRQAAHCWSAIIWPDDIRRSAALVRDAGLQLACDLIFGVPGETLADWQADLDARSVARAGSCFHLWPDIRARHDVLEPPVARPAARAGRRTGAIAFRLRDRPAFGGRASSITKCRTSPGPAAAAGTTKPIGPASPTSPPGPVRRATSAACARRITAARRPISSEFLAGQSPVAEREQLADEDRARELLVFGLRRMAGVERAWFAGATGYSDRRLGRRTSLARHVGAGTAWKIRAPRFG